MADWVIKKDEICDSRGQYINKNIRGKSLRDVPHSELIIMSHVGKN